MNKLGYHYQNLMTYQRAYSAAEEQHQFDHLKAIQPGAALFLDNDGRAQRAKAVAPNCAVVVRAYRNQNDEGKFFETLTPQQTFDLYKDTPKGLIRNIMNEPGGYGDLKKIAHWWAETADLFGNAGIPIVGPNWGEGNPDVDRLADLEEMWDSFDKWHDLHYYGIHEYGSHDGMLYNVGGKFDMFPWRVGRFELFTLPYMQKHGHTTPNVIVTEFGCDSAHDSTAYRGWKTCWTEQQYFDQLQATIDKIYGEVHYVGLCLFSYGNTGRQFTESDWVTFDLSQANDFQHLLEAKESALAADTKPVLIAKPANAIIPKRIRVKNSVHVRYGPMTSFKNIAYPSGVVELQPGTIATIWPDSKNSDGTGRDWVYLNIHTGDFANQQGWVSLTDLLYEEKTATTEIPVITQPVDVPTLAEPPAQAKLYQLVLTLPPELAGLARYFDQIKLEVREVQT